MSRFSTSNSHKHHLDFRLSKFSGSLGLEDIYYLNCTLGKYNSELIKTLISVWPEILLDFCCASSSSPDFATFLQTFATFQHNFATLNFGHKIAKK